MERWKDMNETVMQTPRHYTGVRSWKAIWPELYKYILERTLTDDREGG